MKAPQVHLGYELDTGEPVAVPIAHKVLTEKPTIDVIVERKKVEIDGASVRGRIARLLASGFYDSGATNSATRADLKRTGSDVNNANIDRVLTELLKDGFLTLEGGNQYHAVAGMKVNVIER